MGFKLEDVTMTYPEPGGGSRKVLDIPGLEVGDGRQVCLSGHSGSGKTTLLNILAGITLPTTGRVVYDGEDITRLSEHARDRFRARNVGFVFQTFNLLQGLNALENVQVAAGFAGRRGRAVRERAAGLLERMGLQHRAHARPAALSVGEQQRVAMARAVVNHPKVVLADEPTANLDEAGGDAVLEVLREVVSEEAGILLLVTHERRVQERFEEVLPLKELSR